WRQCPPHCRDLLQGCGTGPARGMRARSAPAERHSLDQGHVERLIAMASYIVLEPAEAGTEKAEAAVLIRDGFSVLALILPLIWFLWHRMWLEAVAFLAIGLAVGGLGALIDSTYLSTALSLLLALLVGLEA